MGDHFDDARGQYHKPDCTVHVQREPPDLDHIHAAGALRFTSVAPEVHVPTKRIWNGDSARAFGLGTVRESSAAGSETHKRRRTDGRNSVVPQDASRPSTSSSIAGATGALAIGPEVAVADSQDVMDEDRESTGHVHIIAV